MSNWAARSTDWLLTVSYLNSVLTVTHRKELTVFTEHSVSSLKESLFKPANVERDYEKKIRYLIQGIRKFELNIRSSFKPQKFEELESLTMRSNSERWKESRQMHEMWMARLMWISKLTKRTSSRWLNMNSYYESADGEGYRSGIANRPVTGRLAHASRPCNWGILVWMCRTLCIYSAKRTNGLASGTSAV